ncbi:hypothetical protein G6015_08790, partial [Dietzia sp. SLG510A3-40A3]|nr:hypothetical protein [Dietzia sp. SLG510A3-30A2]MBB0994373.1 hypothetical protein [Dietzia sp. SLG510A3-40A3]
MENENENGRGRGEPGSPDEWAGRSGAGLEGPAHGPSGQNPYAAENPYGMAQGWGGTDRPTTAFPAQHPAQHPAQAQGQGQHPAQGQGQGQAGPWRPADAMPPS